jgi:putative ABC transport system substrate-binding protein
MRRREFVTLLCGAAAAWPVVAKAQRTPIPVIGWLSMRSASDSDFAVAAFLRGVEETGHIHGQNVTIEYRWLENNHERLPSAVAELVGRQVSVIAVLGSAIAALAAKAATTTIPIVFANGGDPVKDGLVRSLNQPGGNLTGASFLAVALGVKRLELLHELAPNAAVVAMFTSPGRPAYDSQVADVQTAAHAMGLRLAVINVRSEGEVESAFAAIGQYNASALLVGSDPFFTGQRHRLAALAARHRIPAIYSLREYAEAGGLVSYGASLREAFRQVGVYAGRILRGAKPADLPVTQPTKFELVINQKAAKALSLDMPLSILARADEVIE